MGSRQSWSVTVDSPVDTPDTIFVTATDPQGIEPPLYASARASWRKDRWKVEMSLLQTEDGVHVDDTALFLRARREVQDFLDRTSYSYRVEWSDEDGEYVGTADEFPSLSFLAPTADEALGGIRELVLIALADLRRNGGHVPRPASLD